MHLCVTCLCFSVSGFLGFGRLALGPTHCTPITQAHEPVRVRALSGGLDKGILAVELVLLCSDGCAALSRACVHV